MSLLFAAIFAICAVHAAFAVFRPRRPYASRPAAVAAALIHGALAYGCYLIVHSAPVATAELSSEDPKSRALVLCSRYAKASARHPSTVNFSGWGSEVDVHGDGGATVRARFTAKNSFNLELAHEIECDVTSAGSVTGRIVEVPN